nr:hypothetical protein BdHM001_34750 [Bdellovibrio sp. HM001]
MSDCKEDVKILLETDGKKIFLWVNHMLVTERPAKNVHIIGRPLEEARTVQKALVQLGHRTSLEVSDLAGLRTWDFAAGEWVDVPWKKLIGHPGKGQ